MQFRCAIRQYEGVPAKPNVNARGIKAAAMAWAALSHHANSTAPDTGGIQVDSDVTVVTPKGKMHSVRVRGIVDLEVVAVVSYE